MRTEEKFKVVGCVVELKRRSDDIEEETQPSTQLDTMKCLE